MRQPNGRVSLNDMDLLSQLERAPRINTQWVKSNTPSLIIIRRRERNFLRQRPGPKRGTLDPQRPS
jgi:hypothetical protein